MIPSFRSASSTGQTLSLESFRDIVPIALLFIPDLTSQEGLGVVTELNSLHLEFGNLRSQVLVVVKETSRTVREFSDQERLTLPILADASGSIIRSFEVDEGAGRARLAAVVADKHGSLVRRLDPLPAEGAANTLLDLMRQITAK
jgi:peroxiredoxin